MTQAYPLAWPESWPRTPSYQRKRGQFGTQKTKSNEHGSWQSKAQLSIEEATNRVRYELERMGVNARDDAIVSTNLKLNLAGLPRGDQGNPVDPGAAVYWQEKGKPMRVMAIDAYQRVADNIAAIAATLDAMRAIDRHGGAQILDRAFSGFTALPPPKAWYSILGVAPHATSAEIEAAYRKLARKAHPDLGGSAALMAEINAARDRGIEERARG